MSKKREVFIKNSCVEKLVVYTNDKGNEFVQVVIKLGTRTFYICDFKQNDGLLLEAYKSEKGE